MNFRTITSSDELWHRARDYASECSWRAGKSLANAMDNNIFTDWERVIVALDNENICGYCTVTKTDCIPDVRYTPYIGYLFVDEEYRGNRLSQRMIQYAMAYLKTVGFDKVYIVSDHDNLYEKYGFCVIDRKIAPWGSEEKIYMQELNVQSMNITVRLETEKDYRMVEEVTRCAFAYQERIERGQIGCPYEHWMVHELRKRDGIPALSLVAEVEGKIVGHIICSKAEVRTERLTTPVLNMGPISVLPEYQRQGIGKALITSMLDRAKQLGHGAILFFGRPEYYPQFGFKEASVFGITDSEGYNYPSFMGMELVPDYLASAYGGKYYESDIYNDELNREAVKEFDKDF